MFTLHRDTAEIPFSETARTDLTIGWPLKWHTEWWRVKLSFPLLHRHW